MDVRAIILLTRSLEPHEGVEAQENEIKRLVDDSVERQAQDNYTLINVSVMGEEENGTVKLLVMFAKE